MVLWLCKRMSIFIGHAFEIFRGEVSLSLVTLKLFRQIQIDKANWQDKV